MAAHCDKPTGTPDGQPHAPAPYGYGQPVPYGNSTEPQQITGQAPIVINNQLSQNNSVGYGRGFGPRRQSFGAHCVVFLCTAGIGNILYA